MNDVAAHSADPTPLERRRLGLAPCSRSVSTACQRNEQNFRQTFLKTPVETHLLRRTVTKVPNIMGIKKSHQIEQNWHFIV